MQRKTLDLEYKLYLPHKHWFCIRMHLVVYQVQTSLLLRPIALWSDVVKRVTHE